MHKPHGCVSLTRAARKEDLRGSESQQPIPFISIRLTGRQIFPSKKLFLHWTQCPQEIMNLIWFAVLPLAVKAPSVRDDQTIMSGSPFQPESRNERTRNS